MSADAPAPSLAVTPEQVAALKQLAEKATPGPWRVELRHDEVQIFNAYDALQFVASAGATEVHSSHADAAFIAACNPQTILALCQAVERASDWEAWASHQEGCPWCAESSPIDCTNGALLWARCHPENEDAQKIIAERESR